MSETFSKTSTHAIDHLEIAIGIFDFMVQNDLVQKWGEYYMSIFDEYYNLAIRYSSQSEHQRIAQRARDFIGHNTKHIKSISPTALNDINHGLPTVDREVIHIISLKDKVKNKIKAHMRPILPKTSLSYRAQRHILGSVSSMHHKIDKLERDNLALSKQLVKISQQLERLTKK
jgi:hypothetical protein